jgi:RNA polymerase sigma-70 factor (ECF subfamily)
MSVLCPLAPPAIATAAQLQLFPASGVLHLNEHTPVQPSPTGSNTSAEFTIFMRAYQDMVFSTAARLAGDDRQAEDIAQEVFLKAYEHFEQLHANPAAGGWLRTVATNLTLNHLSRYRKRWRSFSELRPGGADEDPSAPDFEIAQPDTLLADLGAEQRSVRIEAALRKLPEQQRLALVLYHFEELSYEEIAAKLTASLSKIKTDIRRGRAALLPLLHADGVGAAAPENQ